MPTTVAPSNVPKNELNRGEGHDQRAGGARQCAAEGPVRGRQAIRRPPERPGGHLVRGRRARGQAEEREALHEAEDHGDRHGDAEQDEAVRLHTDAEHLASVLGQELGDGRDRVAVVQRRRGLDDDEHAQRRDDPHDRGGGSQRPHDRVLDDDAEHRADRDGREQSDDDARAVLAQLREDDRADQGQRSLGEVDDARPLVGEHDALGKQRVDRRDPEAKDRELQDLVHDFDSVRPLGFSSSDR
jgi:hypothetical protein